MKRYHRHQILTSINRVFWLLIVIALSGLTGCKSVVSGQMPNDGLPMEKSYQQAMMEGNDNQSDKSHAALSTLRSQVAQPIDGPPSNTVNNMSSNIVSGIHRLPNPDVMLYSYSHWVGIDNDEILVPGYWTVFPEFPRISY